MNTTSRTPVWVGTAEVVPRTGNLLLGTARGAYVAVVGIAVSSSAFQAGVERAMSALEFEMCMLDDVRQIASEHDYSSLDEELREKALGLNVGNPIEFGHFHAFSD